MNRIEHVSIQGYRAIKKVEFTPKTINIFVGRNNCGKSSILEAIALNLSGSTNFLDAVGNNVWTDLTYVKKYNPNFFPYAESKKSSIELKINNRDRNSTIEILEEGYPNDERGSIIQTFFQKKVDEYLQKGSTISEIKDLYSSHKKTESSTRQVTFEGLSSPSSFHEDIENQLFSDEYDALKFLFNNYISNLKDELITDIFKQRKVVLTGYLDSKLEYISVVFFNAPNRRLTPERYRSTENFSRRFFMEFLDIRMPSRFVVVNIYATKEPESNLLVTNLEHSNEPFDLSHLHDLLVGCNRINLTVDNLREKITYFEDIRKTDSGLQIFIKGQKSPLPVSSMGDGFSSLLKLSFMNNILNSGTIILEEPERTLHPGFLFILCEAILNNSKDSQFFISTHSLDFIKALLKVFDWSNQLDDIQIIRMHSQPDVAEIDIETISGINAKNEIEDIGRDLRGI